MIRRLILLCTSLFILIVLSVVAACLIGSKLTPPPIAEIFTNPDGTNCKLPCMFGIKAEEAKQAVDLLKEHPLTRDLSASTTDCSKASAFLSNRDLVLYIRCGKDDLITFSLDKRLGLAPYPRTREETPLHATTLAQIVSIFGAPDYVDPVTSPFGSTLIYSRMGVVISFQRPYPADPRLVINPDEKLLWITMQDRRMSINKTWQRWIGFSTRYSRLRVFN